MAGDPEINLLRVFGSGQAAELKLAAVRLVLAGKEIGAMVEVRAVMAAWLLCIAEGDPNLTGLPSSPSHAREWSTGLQLARLVNEAAEIDGDA